ncbi:MAG TPA: xanthine dehydrogenase family protein subunit M [Bauldia sp.]|nr:xanthine dehydrogenase family protein subunit M [Bauldia sp.]
MKPAAFEYFAPRSVEEATALLAQHGSDGRVLAGGQSLVPAMNFRLARPAVLVDINGIDRLAGVREEGDRIIVGTLTRHVVFEKPVTDGPLAKLLPTIAHNIAHLPIRIRGTFGGSIAHADPAAEWCALAVALGAEIVVRSTGGSRTVAAGDWFRSIFTTDLRDGEMVTEVRLPRLGDDWRCGFVEFNRRAGDFALVAAVAALRIEGGLIREARLALGGVVDKPVRAEAAESLLLGQTPGDPVFRAAAEAARGSLEPFGDIHADAEYKSELVAVMARRALERAVAA